MRQPGLRGGAGAWWGEEAREGRWVLRDEGVRGVAGKLGVGFDEGNGEGEEEGEEGGAGRLRVKARGAVRSLVSAGFVVSEYWKVG